MNQGMEAEIKEQGQDPLTILKGVGDHIQDTLPHTQMFNITNVCDHVHSQMDGDRGSYNLREDFSVLQLPFPAVNCKHVGMVWRSAHFAGDREKGEITHRYKVETPEAA